MRKRLLTSIAATAFSIMGFPAFADVLTPLACPDASCLGFSGTIGVGETTFINNQVGVISAGAPTTGQADVLFISDTTRGMGTGLVAVRSVFGSVVSNLAGLGNVATGAAQFRDLKNSPGAGFDYSLDQPITTDAASTQATIASWLGAGGTGVAAQSLFALTQAAGAATGWRVGSKRIAVIVGDTPSESGAAAAGGATVGSTAAALLAAGVTVESINVGSNPVITLNQAGQFAGAGSIYAAGVAGHFLPKKLQFSSIVLTSLLANAIGHAFTTYTDVSLALIDSAGPCSAVMPSGFTGTFDRSIDRTFDFGPVSITGIAAGVCDLTIALEADGVVLATETDTIQVGNPNQVVPPSASPPQPDVLVAGIPESTTLALLGLGMLGLGFARLRVVR